jgi:two-component system chemotaxis sensor kinase CheA
MSKDKAVEESFVEWVNDAVGDFFLLDQKDQAALAKFLQRLDAKAKELASCEEPPEDYKEVSGSLEKAAGLVKSIIFGEADDAAQSFKEVGNLLEHIGKVAADPSREESRLSAEAPESSLPSDTSCEENEGSASAESDDSSPWVDKAIVSAYVEQQLQVLPEIEQKILDIEKEGDAESLGGLRRLLHTMKGESGVVGAMSIEAVCHRIEDYLEVAGAQVETDRLFAALDWVDQSVRSFGSGNPPPPSDEISALLSAPDSPVETGRQEEDPEEPPDTNTKESIAIADVELALDFVAESQEHFDSADENLLVLEKKRDDADAIGAVFRAFHTIKGVAGFLGLPPIGDLAHVAETLLDEVRKGVRVFEGAVVDVVFDALDALKEMVSDLRDAVSAGEPFRTRPNYAGVLASLHSVQSGTPLPPPGATAADPPEEEADTETPADPLPAEPPREKSEKGDSSAVSQQKVAVGAVQSMKVDAARIDQLLDTIGELVIAESIVSGEPEIRQLKSLRVEKSISLLGKITRSLQDMGMSMRLVPLDPVFRKMGRLVRDLSKKSGKQVNLIIEGGDTEMDKSMVEKLGDPLVHMIRNSMDHGIELPDDRKATGKPEIAKVVLRAYHQGGSIHIDIEDDGRGLNRDTIARKAVERGLIDSADGMSDQDVFSLIFQPGFSTAEKVTEISGRGVGMDVVRRNIEALRGKVLIRSTLGKGSVFTLALPLTTAIIDGMQAQVGKEIYIIPTLSILESFRPQPSQVHSVSGKGEMVSFRGNLLPMFRLQELLGVDGAETQPVRAIIIVVEEFGKHWALMVDEILGKQQVVIKNLGDGLGPVSGIAGASILADGRPGLILDIGGLVRLATKDSRGGRVV